MDESKGRPGPKPLGKAPMTSAERQARVRAAAKAKALELEGKAKVADALTGHLGRLRTAYDRGDHPLIGKIITTMERAAAAMPAPPNKTGKKNGVDE